MPSGEPDPRERPLLLLWGFMGTGKSAAGRSLATELAIDFVDLDERVAELASRSIPEIFAELGEPGFRELEKRALCAQLAALAAPRVVALGGGALLAAELRRRALAEAFVVVLCASPDTIARRARGGGRPLLQPDPEAAIARLLRERQAAYAEAHATVPTDLLDVAGVVQALSRLWSGVRACSTLR